MRPGPGLARSARPFRPARPPALVVEVVSPESEDRDRETKPAKYARAGIRFLWRIEREGSTPVAYTYELDPASGTYVATGVHRGRLKTDIGFPVDIDLAIRS
ncbi:MAG TPA: Uma2 family endonuclease [Trebonia sp.]|nr:Uma2 family endonuclease [Trebonia sp.]